MTPEEFRAKLTTGELSQADFDAACDALSRQLVPILMSETPPHFEVLTAVFINYLRGLVTECPNKQIQTVIVSSIAQLAADLIKANNLELELVMELMDDEEPDIDLEVEVDVDDKPSTTH